MKSLIKIEDEVIVVDGYGKMRIEDEIYINGNDIHNIGKQFGNNDVTIKKTLKNKWVMRKILEGYLDRNNIGFNNVTYALYRQMFRYELMRYMENKEIIKNQDTLNKYQYAIDGEIIAYCVDNYKDGKGKYYGKKMLKDMRGTVKKIDGDKYYSIEAAIGILSGYSTYLSKELERCFIENNLLAKKVRIGIASYHNLDVITYA